MNTKKITKLKLEKTEDYIKTEWVKVSARRQHLLLTSDWTQLEDNELTFESRVRWNHWRNLVRQVKRSNYPSIPEAEEALLNLENVQPPQVFIESLSMRQKKYHLDISNLAQAKTDAANILKQFHHEWMTRDFPENINLINYKFDELQSFMLSSATNVIDDSFPLLQITAKVNGWSDSDTADHIMTLKRTATEIMVQVESHRVRFTNMIKAAQTVDRIIDIVKEMHGY